MRILTVAVVLAGLAVACHRPVLWPEPVTPVILGTLRWEAGGPIEGEEIRISGARGDSTCRHATRRTATGPQGYFQLPPANLEIPIPIFYACALIGADTQFIDAGVWYAPSRVDSVSCMAWHWDTRIRLTCERAGEHRIFDGGRWRQRTTDPYDGFYRALLVTEKIRAPNGETAAMRPVLYVHWLRPLYPANGRQPPFTLAAITRFPMEEEVFKLAAASFWERNDTTFLTVAAFKHRSSADTTLTRLTYRFGEFFDEVVRVEEP